MNKKLLICIVIIAVVASGVTIGVLRSESPPSDNHQSTITPEIPEEQTQTVGGLEAKKYTDTEHGYTILYPKGWTVESTTEHTVEIRNSLARIVIDATYYSCDPLSEYVSQMRRILEDNLGYEIISHGQILEDESTEACMDVVTSGDVLASHGGAATTEVHLYMKAKPCGWALRVMSICLSEDWDYHEDIFIDVMKSFRLLE